jgi:hypothetical protein
MGVLRRVSQVTQVSRIRRGQHNWLDQLRGECQERPRKQFSDFVSQQHTASKRPTADSRQQTAHREHRRQHTAESTTGNRPHTTNRYRTIKSTDLERDFPLLRILLAIELLQRAQVLVEKVHLLVSELLPRCREVTTDEVIVDEGDRWWLGEVMKMISILRVGWRTECWVVCEKKRGVTVSVQIAQPAICSRVPV